MKKVLFVVFSVCIILGMSNCSNGDMEQEDLFSGDNPLIGTWEGNNIDFDKLGYPPRFRLTFNETTASLKFLQESGGDRSGTYTFDGRLIIISYQDINNLDCFIYEDNYLYIAYQTYDGASTYDLPDIEYEPDKSSDTSIIYKKISRKVSL